MCDILWRGMKSSISYYTSISQSERLNNIKYDLSQRESWDFFSAGFQQQEWILKNDVLYVAENGNPIKQKKYFQLCLSLDQHPSLPFSTNLIKINHSAASSNFTTESKPVPGLDYSSARASVRHLFVIVFWRLRRSTRVSGVSFLLFFQLRGPRWMWPGCYLRSCWQKSPRTNPPLNFQQRRENISAVIQFNVAPFGFSPSHISVKSFRNNVTHTHTHWFIDYVMSPAVMFQSNVHSVIV